MALYVTRPRRDEVRMGRGLPSGVRMNTKFTTCHVVNYVFTPTQYKFKIYIMT